MPNPLVLDVRVAADGWDDLFGEKPEAFALKVLKAAAKREGRAGDVAVLFTDDAEMRTLNRTWKGKDKPTNVLSFPAPEGFGSLGDVALGFETIAAEAVGQGKTRADHAAHLLVHGFLHLLGYDHQNDADAERMEDRERAILSDLGIADPYDEDRAGGQPLQGAARER